MTLPLNVIAIIVSYLDDIGDLARVTRTARLLHYMALPLLYQRVDLHSYSEMRYFNGRPEGFGSGSPFSMALNGLVTRPHASLVQDFRVSGQWKEFGLDDFSKGRVPDSTMMLNILLRSATDRMAKLQSFCWELDCKPLKTLYQGLATHNHITSLTLRFPNSRIPRPAMIIPPIPSLKAFKVLDIDPLCYPDDISLLLLQSKRLEDLRIHFSPRMRLEAECSLNMDTFFARCQKAGYKPNLRHFAMQNFFGVMGMGLMDFLNDDTIESLTCIDCIGGINGDARTIFVDEMWKMIPMDCKSTFKSIRLNEMVPKQIDSIKTPVTGLERFYMISSKREKVCCQLPHPDSPLTPEETPKQDTGVAALGPLYLHALTRQHGPTLKHLLMSDQWGLTLDDIRDLINYCPNLEQVGIALKTTDTCNLRLLIPFLSKLTALRLLPSECLAEHMRSTSHEEIMRRIEDEMIKLPNFRVRYLGVGDFVYKYSGMIKVNRDDGTAETRPKFIMTTKADVAHVEIFGLDCLDISADPVIITPS